MPCLCGSLGCSSCGPAQGSNPVSEAAFDYVYARLTEWLDTTPVIVSQGDEDDATLHDAAQFSDEFNVKFSDGEEEGLVRLTSLVLDLMKEAVAAARSEDAASWAELARAQEAEVLDQELFVNDWPQTPAPSPPITIELSEDEDEDGWATCIQRVLHDEE